MPIQSIPLLPNTFLSLSDKQYFYSVKKFIIPVILIAIAAFFLLKGKPGRKEAMPLSDGSVKIKVVNVINPTLTGNEYAFIDEQESNVQINDKSDPAEEPEKKIGDWWNFSDASNSSALQLDYHPYRVKNLPGPITYEFQLDGLYTLTKICVYLKPKKSNSQNMLLFKTGTPFHYNTTVGRIIDDGTVSGAQWIDLSMHTDTRFVQLAYGNQAGLVKEIVFYGKLKQLDTASALHDPLPSLTVDSSIGTNIVFQMGQSADGKNYDEGWVGGLRWFAAACYLLKKDLSFKHASGTAGDVETYFNKRIIQSGSALHYVMGSMTDSSMVSPTNNSGGDWAGQKPIPGNLINEKTADRLNGICTFNEIADKPASYAQAAWNLKRFAKAFYALGHRSIEPDNERDLNFKGAGFMYPYQQAAMMSCYFDGHNNTIQFKNESVGIRNSGLDKDQMKLIFPGLANVNPTYIRAMWWWWKYNRKNGDMPFDVFNIHAYPTSLGMQGSGNSGQALMPENKSFNLEQKLDTAIYFARLFGTPLINTESGYDAYTEKMKHPSQYCNEDTRWGNSFMAIHTFAQKTSEQIQAEWLLRDWLLHCSRGIVLYQYWLADQYADGTTCGTFNASGLLKYDSVYKWKQQYIPRPAWYAIQTFKTRLQGYVFEKEIIEDDFRLQYYHVRNNPGKKAMVTWLQTNSGKQENKTISLPASLPYQIITPTLNTEGKVMNATGNSVTILVNEMPQVIFY